MINYWQSLRSKKIVELGDIINSDMETWKGKEKDLAKTCELFKELMECFNIDFEFYNNHCMKDNIWYLCYSSIYDYKNPYGLL